MCDAGIFMASARGVCVVEGRRLALCDEESKSFENGAIQLAPIVPVPITFLFFYFASAFARSMALAMVGRVLSLYLFANVGFVT